MNKKIALLALILLTGFAGFGQGATEYRLWSSVALQTNLDEVHKLTGSVLYRDLSGLELDRFIAEIELDRKAGRHWTQTVELRHYGMLDDFGAVKGVEHRGRIRFMAERTYTSVPGTFKMRYGLQHREIYTGLGTRKTDFRVRAAYEMGIKDFGWDPEFQVEYLGTLGGDYNKRLRMGFQTSDGWKWGKIGVGYFYERNLSQTGFHYHSMTLDYTFKR